MGCGKLFSSAGKNIIRGGMMMKRNQLLAGGGLLSLAGGGGRITGLEWSCGSRSGLHAESCGCYSAEDGNDRNRNTCDGNGGHR